MDFDAEVQYASTLTTASSKAITSQDEVILFRKLFSAICAMRLIFAMPYEAFYLLSESGFFETVFFEKQAAGSVVYFHIGIH